MLQVKNLYKIFNENTLDEKIALNNVNLQLNKGDFVTIIGSNGAGKSTLLNLIAGKFPLDAGEIHLDGENITYAKEFVRSTSIGRVFQDPMIGTAGNMTLEENLAIAYNRTKRRGLKKGITKQRKVFFQEQLELLELGLENRLNTKIGLLSGGERQAVSLLMATFIQPKLLLLDEHTAALDPSKAELVTYLTKKLVEQMELTTLMVTHNMAQAIELGNRIFMMDKGEIIFQSGDEEKKNLTVDSLLMEFQNLKQEKLLDDRTVLI